MKRICLVIIDGWGLSQEISGNPLKNAAVPNFNGLSGRYGNTPLFAHGPHVGLLPDQVGNSEVGHLTIGSGRIIQQDITRITQEIKDSAIAQRLVDAGVVDLPRLHFLGLVSDGGVHSHSEILKTLIAEAKKINKSVFLHFVSDGRDTAPRSFERYFKDIEEFIKNTGCASIASVAGRFYAMDRDKRQERTDLAFSAVTGQQGVTKFEDLGLDTLESDEMLRPALLMREGAIEEGDAVFFFNYRADRMRQITQKFIGRNRIFTLTEYDPDFNAAVVFTREKVAGTLAEAVARAGLRQTHIAESEKKAHVTYFLNGGTETPFPGEKRIIVQSPRVPSYAEAPEMCTAQVAAHVCEELRQGMSFVVCNIAAPDMVGHTGDFGATCIAVEATDRALGKIYDACTKTGHVLVITADHGNCEAMIDEAGGKVTKHTANKVPFIVCDDHGAPLGQEHSLRDVAPTVLKYLGVPKPEQMTGATLF